MSWLYVPALEDSNSASASPSPERAASVTSRGKPMPPQSLSRAWKTGGFIRRLSGLTLEPSILNRGVASFIASLRETPASPTASPGSAWATPTTAGSSTRFSASSIACGLIVSSARTSRGTPTGSSQPSSRHWKGWATALRRDYSARPKPGRPINGSACSSWPTARTVAGGYTRDKGDPEKERPTLEGLSKTWTTPRASDGEKGGPNMSFGGGGTPLPTMAAHWPTPRASEAGPDFAKAERSNTGLALPAAAVAWPTPSAKLGDEKRGMPSQELASARMASGRRNLDDAIAAWPTPASRDYRSPNSQDSQDRRNTNSARGQQLPNFVADLSRSSRPVPAIPDGSKSSATRRTLNPLFVEWLMGWPIGWTACAPVEMGSSRWLGLMRGELSTLLSGLSEGRRDGLFWGAAE